MTAADLARVADIIRDLPPSRLDAWLICGQRIVDGMPTAEAEALMWREVAEAEGARPC